MDEGELLGDDHVEGEVGGDGAVEVDDEEAVSESELEEELNIWVGLGLCVGGWWGLGCV